MAVSNIPNYKLDGRFLKELMFESLEKPSANEFSIELPVLVQVLMITEVANDEWSLYFLSDGEFEMSRCAFVSKQARPERYSILKINKIIKLPLKLTNNTYRVGVIEFDIEVSGEQIGFRLYQNLKIINLKELMGRKKEIGCLKLKEDFETPYSTEIMKNMWENRSEQFCDLNFTFEDEDGIVVFTHRSVLVAASEVFRAHSDNEGFIDNKSVHIVDSSSHTFNKLLEFIYMGKVQFTTWKIAFKLLYLSKKYLMPRLEKLCQNGIQDFCSFDSENLLKVFEENKKVNDEKTQNGVTNYVLIKTYEVIHSNSFLECAFSTVEWIFSLDLGIDEWSRLCAIYKWARRNGANAFCQRMGDEIVDEPLNCLHALFEYVHYENIDGLSLKRFLKLPKLSEIIDVSQLNQSIFERLLEDESYFNIGTNYPKYRSSNNADAKVYTEIEIESSEEKKMKDIQLSNDGPVLGFKIKVEQKIKANGERSLDIVPSFRYICHKDGSNVDKVNVYFDIKTIKTKSRISQSKDNYFLNETETLERGEWVEFRMHLHDCRGYMFEKIEDFDIEDIRIKNKFVKVISLDMEIEKRDTESDSESE